MLEVKINDEVFNIKQLPSEFTIREYEDMVNILNNNVDEFDKYYNLFIFLGLPSYYLDEFDVFNFKELISEYNSITIDDKIVNSITVDGRVFKSFDGDFKISVRQMKECIKYINEDNSRCLGEIIAIFFHEVGLSREDNWDSISDRAELFRDNITANIANPYFIEVYKKIYENTK